MRKPTGRDQHDKPPRSDDEEAQRPRKAYTTEDGEAGELDEEFFEQAKRGKPKSHVDRLRDPESE